MVEKTSNQKQVIMITDEDEPKKEDKPGKSMSSMLLCLSGFLCVSAHNSFVEQSYVFISVPFKSRLFHNH